MAGQQGQYRSGRLAQGRGCRRGRRGISGAVRCQPCRRPCIQPGFIDGAAALVLALCGAVYGLAWILMGFETGGFRAFGLAGLGDRLWVRARNDIGLL